MNLTCWPPLSFPSPAAAAFWPPSLAAVYQATAPLPAPPGKKSIHSLSKCIDKLLIKVLGSCQRAESWVRTGCWCAVILTWWLLKSCFIPSVFISGGQPGMQLVFAGGGPLPLELGRGRAAWPWDAPGITGLLGSVKWLQCWW